MRGGSLDTRMGAGRILLDKLLVYYTDHHHVVIIPCFSESPIEIESVRFWCLTSSLKPFLRAMANKADETEDGEWDSDGLGYHTPGDDEDGDMEMLEAACEDCGPLHDRPASA